MTKEPSSQEQANTFLQTLGQLLEDQALGLPPEHRRRLQQEIDRVVNYHATVGVLGKTGAGKSSLCNALFGKDVAEVSDIAACTREPQEIELAIKQGKGISLIDMPGVGESEQRDEEYAALYRRLLPELDLVLWVVKGDDRALSVDEYFYQKVVHPLIVDSQLPVVFVISQIDKIEPCREWDWKKNQPGPYQFLNIEAKLESVCHLFKIPRSQACAVSAEEGYGLIEFVEAIVRTLPNEKKWSFTREAKSETVSACAWQESTQGVWETVKSAAMSVLREGWAFVSGKLSALADKLFGW